MELDDIDGTLERIRIAEKELVENRVCLLDLEFACDVESAKLYGKSKEEWAELKITNAEGRKAFVDLELASIRREIIKVKSRILRYEADLKNLNRILDFQVWKHDNGGRNNGKI